MNRNRIYLASPTMNGFEMKYINEAFETNWIAPLGPNVNEFENEIIKYTNGGFATALVSGTAALHLAIKLSGVNEGDKVFCSNLTFSASANPILYEKAIPVFIDSEMDTWNMDPIALEKAFKEHPEVKAVIVTNLYGIPGKLDEIALICEKYNVPMIEDAAESLGAKYKGRHTGTFGRFGAFSFNGNKIITTSGGGMLISKYSEDIDRARYLATQAREPGIYYHHVDIGYNYRMSNILAGIGRGQLITLDQYIEKKRNIYNIYKNGLSNINAIKMNPYIMDSEPNFWLSCISLSDDSNVKPLDIINALEKENIESRPIWKPMHLQPVFSNYDFVTLNKKEKSVSDKIFNNGLCLPSDIKNSDEDMDKIINIIKALFKY